MVIKEKLGKIKNGSLTAEENVKKKLQLIEEKDEDINSFIQVSKERALEKAKKVDKKIEEGKAGKLAGLTIGIKSNINVEDLPITCASKTLEDYKGSFNADVIRKIEEEDGIIIGMTNMDEFACGISGETSSFGSTKNPSAEKRVPGGSSSGSAASVAAKMCDLSLGSDTGGSIRNPASHCGIVGIKPSYGRVSRYGLIDLSMSLDQIGPLSPDVYGAALLLEVIAGHSDRDPTTYDEEVEEYTSFDEENIKIGLCKSFEKLCKDNRLYELVKDKAEELSEKKGYEIKSIELDNVELGVQTYYPIVYTEFFSSTRRFDGRKYGKKIEDSAGEEVLRRILGGKEISKSEYEGKYYRRALSAKEIIKEEFKKAFQEVDFILSPVTPRLPHKKSEEVTTEEAYAMDAFTTLANLAGITAASIPLGEIDEVPVGMHVMADDFDENKLVNFLKEVEELD